MRHKNANRTSLFKLLTFFSGNMEKFPLMTVSSRKHLDGDQNKNDETRDIESFKDGNFLAFRFNYHRQSHTHHKHNQGKLFWGIVRQ